jgi:lipopolysaccharide export LptBFGC system permease protein LptF
MSLLDRYISRQYLTNIAVLLVIVFSFVVAVDVAFNLDRFWERAGEIAKDAGGTASGPRRSLLTVFLVADLWWPRLIQLFNYLNPLVLVGAMGFTCRQMVRHRELVAVLTAGQSLYRVARPIVVVAVVLQVMQAANQELVIPRIAPLLTRDPGDAGTHTLGSTAVPLTKDAAGRLFRAASFDADAGTLAGLYVVERDAAGRATRRITADRARWREGGWDLTNGLALSRGSAAGVPIRRIETNLDPLALRVARFKGLGQHLSWRQIGQILGSLERAPADTATAETNRRARDRLERVRYARIATGLSSVLTLLIAMSFVLRRDPSHLTRHILRCIPLVLLALVGGVFGSAAAIPAIPAQLSVFIPTMILSVVAVALVARVQT